MKDAIPIFLTLLLIPLNSKAQEPEFTLNPLKIEPSLSGNYGELRPNHFHAGIDLKTGGVMNLPVAAVQSGFVSRIKISPYGYGKAIYIDHPDGYTTVYAHLNGFPDRIAEFIKTAQYDQQSFSVDIHPAKSDLPIKKGSTIAYTGNSGSSAGPHLHFELRETKSEIPRNPLLFGFPIEDSKNPVIEAIGIHDFDEGTETRFRVAKGTIVSGSILNVSQSIGILVSGYDSQNGSENRNGIFKLECFVDGILYSQFKADSIPFGKSRQLNALINYDHYYQSNQRFIRLYKLPGNFLDNLKTRNQTGRIHLTEGTHQIKIIAADAAGNISKVKFEVEASESNSKPDSFIEEIECSGYYFYESERFKITLQPYALYENVPLVLKEKTNKLEFLNPSIPINYPVEIQLKSPKQKGEILARFGKPGKPIQALSTTRDGDWLLATSKSLGIFGVTIDSIAPSIKSINFVQSKYYSQEILKFRITDNFSGIESFRVLLNGKWILATYEPKQNELSIDLDLSMPIGGQQEIFIEVIDMAGNVGTFEGSFYKNE